VSWNLSSQSRLFDLRVLLRPLGALFSFEAVFIFFLVSSNYKLDPRLSFVPIDLTLIFMVVGVAMGLVIVYREGIYLPGLVVVSLLVVFIVWVLLTTMWTPSEIYAREKLLKLATLNLWAVIATAMIIANRRERARRFMVLVLVLSAAASMDGVLQYSGLISPYSGVVTRSGMATEAFSANFRLENNLAHARFYGSGALMAFVAWLYASPFSKRGVALMAVFAICSCGLLITGGRGPTLAVLAAMMLPLALGLRFTDRRLFASKALVASFVLLAVVIVALVQSAPEFSENLRTLQRLGVLFTAEEGGGSAAARIERWIASWHFWLKQPLFGDGVGSWPVLFHGRDELNYPHNLIVEVLVEFGLIGLLLLAAVAVAAARRVSVRRLREDPVLMCAAMLCISTFLASMTSSDIIGNRGAFAMLGLLVMRPFVRTADVRIQDHAPDRDGVKARHPDLVRGLPHPGRSRV